MTVEEFLGRLNGVKPQEDGWIARCPAHDDRHASLTVAEGDDGRILVRCHAGGGCSFEEIVAALGLKPADLFDRQVNSGSRRIVATYDYEDEQGALLFQAVRFDPKGFAQRRPDGRGGWIWKLEKTRRVLYRLPRVLEGVTAGRTIFVCEGEKDVHALEDAGEVATCNPMGAGKWRDTFSTVLRGADVVVVRDRDEEGEKHAAKVAASLEGVAEGVHVVEAGEGKDASDHLKAGLTVDEFVRVEPDDPDTRTNESKPAPVSQEDVRNRNPDMTGQTPALALELDILARFRADLRRAGVAGEEKLAQLVYLALTSRVLPWGKPTERPISLIPKGTTSTGKSWVTQSVLRFLPASAYVLLGSMSKRYLFFSEESFAHRFIVVAEWASIADDDELVALLRTLLSEGRVFHGTVEGGDRRTARLIEKEGPTALLVTTTRSTVDLEMETRCLSIVTDDTPAQTGRVYEVYADLEDDIDNLVDFDAWHDLQLWIAEEGEARVIIPFIRPLAELMPTVATRLRRDFVSLLCLIRAHAILYQAQRERDERGRIVATVEGDYAPIRDLVGDLIAEGVEASVSPATRATVEAVQALLDDGAEHVSPKALSNRLGVGRSATYDRIHRALTAGYLANEAGKDERGMKLVVGSELPSRLDFLPSTEEIVRVRPDGPPGHDFGSTIGADDGLSGSPGRPVTSGTDVELECGHHETWLARDGKRRCSTCHPPAFAGEVVAA